LNHILLVTLIAMRVKIVAVGTKGTLFHNTKAVFGNDEKLAYNLLN